MKDDVLILKAKEFAMKAHEGVVRQATGQPFWTHPEHVAELVEASGGNTEEIVAAWLHDTVEDTSVTIEDIKKEFGENIALIVDGLTDPIEYVDMETLERKTLQAKRVVSKSESVKRVKIADQIHNAGSLLECAPPGWDESKIKVYIEGARRIVEACKGTNEYLENIFNQKLVKLNEKFGPFQE